MTKHHAYLIKIEKYFAYWVLWKNEQEFRSKNGDVTGGYSKCLANPIFDNSVIKYQYHAYQPLPQAYLSSTDKIRIVIQHGDLYTLPSESYISIEGHLTFNVLDFSQNGASTFRDLCA